MKKNVLRCVLLVLFPFCGLSSFAQAPHAIPFQAVARDNNGNPIANQNVVLRFSIIDSVINGPVVYQETHNTTTNSLGLFVVYICQGATTGPFDPLKWEKLNKFVKIEIDIDGSGVYTDMGTQQLLSVPYALYAEKSGSSLGSVVYVGTWDASTNDHSLSSSVGTKGNYYVVSNEGSTNLDGITDWNVGDWAIYNGTVWQKVDNSESIISPTGSVVYVGTWDASINDRSLSSSIGTKGNYYVVSVAGNTDLNGITDWQIGDWAIFNGTKWEKVDNYDEDIPTQADAIIYVADANITSTNVQDAIEEVYGVKVNRSGDTMTGDLILNADPTSALGSATKQYVDATNASLQTQVNAKVNRAGDTMTGDLILNADPTSALGAATKQYVDAHSSVVVPNGTAVGQTLHWDGSAWVADDSIYSDGKRFGVGVLQPEYPLEVRAKGDKQRAIAIKSDNGGNNVNWLFGNRSVDPDSGGFNIEQEDTGGKVSRFFIQQSSGNIGLGTTLPEQRLHLQSSFAEDRDFLGLKVYNEAAQYNKGWSLGHVHDNSVSARDGAFSFIENTTTDPLERITILPGGNVGMGTTMPSEKLHIEGAASDGIVGLKILNTATASNNGWAIGHVDDNTISVRKGALSINFGSGIPTTGLEKLTILPGGNVGINEPVPDVKLHVSRSVSDPASAIDLIEGTGIMVLGPMTDNIVMDYRGIQARTGSYVSTGLQLSTSSLNLQRLGGDILVHGSSTNNDKVIITSGGNVGVSELTPDVKLHVSRPVSDPAAAVDLIEGTGIMVLGPMTDNIVMDYRGIQARTGSYVSTGLQLSASSLNLQKLGGDILIHGNSSIPDAQKVIIKDDGKMGLGTLSPQEKFDIDGAIKIGTTTTDNDGTIRYTGTDFEGRKGSSWVSLTTSNGPWTIGVSGIYYDATNPKVGIGITTPTSSLQVDEHSNVTADNTAVHVINRSATTSSGQDDNRVGLQVENTGTWGGDPASKNIGLYVKEVSGQSSSNVNLAAVMNGNVVIGGVSSADMVGANGTNVLAIQNGTAPSPLVTSSGLPDGGIQVYSAGDASSVSTFNVKNGDGTVIKLYRSSALSAPDNTTLNTSTYGTSEAAVINNLRTRINELESKLQALGLLE